MEEPLMDGMQFNWWDVEAEYPSDPTVETRRTFNLNFPGISAIAEIGAASFTPLLVAPDNHYLACGFTGCTWVDASGETHVEDLVNNLPTYAMWPITLSRNGLTRLSGEIDGAAISGRVNLNVFIWPHVT
jgi:hypothetical protein